MALVKETLKQALVSVFSKTNDPETAADELATAIDAYIKTATVTTVVTGAVTTGAGAGGSVTGSGAGSLS